MATILIIDDVSEIRGLLKNYLKLKPDNYNILTAKDGLEALEIAKVESVDIILTDMLMPNFNGVETILEFEKLYPKTKIIAMSGNFDNADACLNIAERLDVIKTFHKPFNLEELAEFIHELSEDFQ